MPMVDMRSARSAKTDPVEIAEDILTQLGGFVPKLVTLFAARRLDHHALNKALRDRLPKGTRLLGASTGGEIDNSGMHSGTTVVGALGGDLDVAIGLGENLSKDAASAGERAVLRAAEELGHRLPDLDTKKTVGLVIDDGFRNKKEEMLLGILDRNQALSLVGGGASDEEQDPEKRSALIHVDGQVVTDATLVALIKTDAPWAALRSHWYEPTGQMVKITKVDDSHLRALEIDGQPATKRYAELVDVANPEELEFSQPRGFGLRPTALRVGREYFIRAPWKPLPDGSILFANLLDEGTEYEVMRRGDMVGLTKNFFENEIPRRVRNPKGALFFNCGARAWLSYNVGNFAEVAQTFATAPTCVGLTAYFEIYCGFCVNNTLTSLVFGQS
jgi:hypothetical protein